MNLNMNLFFEYQAESISIYVTGIKFCNMSKCGFNEEIGVIINIFTFKFSVLNKIFELMIDQLYLSIFIVSN